jgi:hypothetical protein
MFCLCVHCNVGRFPSQFHSAQQDARNEDNSNAIANPSYVPHELGLSVFRLYNSGETYVWESGIVHPVKVD